MDGRKLPTRCTVVFVVALIALVLDAGGGPGWGGTSAHTLLATRADHLAASPLYDVLASIASLLPAGEPGFRLGVLTALLGACTLAGVVALAGALLPKDPAAGIVGALLLALAPAFREAAAFATPSLLAAAGSVWAIALAITFARGRAATPAIVALDEDRAPDDRSASGASGAPDERSASGASGAPDQRAARPTAGRADMRDARDAALALAACVLVICSAPWLGAALTVAIVVGLARAGARRDHLAIDVGAIGLVIVVLWIGASGALPGRGGGLAALAAGGRGAGAIVVGGGLLGAAFATLTGLPRAGWLGIALVVALAHEVIVGGTAPVVLALLAAASAIIPSALVRVAANAAVGWRRHAITLVAGAPLVAVARLTGATLVVEDPGATPTALARDLVDRLPPGSGIFVATRPTTWLALEYEMTIAGARPDLTLVPPLPETQADAVVANALREDRIVGADVAAFGRLDIQRAIPRGRGFQLVGERPAAPTSVIGPARYATAIGVEQAILLALERARFEAANGRLDAAARALGLEARFGAADLAVLGSTVPSSARPALFGFLPLADEPTGPWLLETFGDDLAWVAGVPVDEPAANAPMPRRLHARWRAILAGTLSPDDPSIAALGPAAVRATAERFTKTPR